MKKLVVITGASSGFGMATAKKLSKLGHPLLLIARRVEILKEMNLPNSLCEKVDVTDYDTFANAIKKAEKEFGPVDCIVNNAGVMLLGNVATQDPKEFKKMLDVNVEGLLYGINIVLSGMIERKSGTIVNISSVAGRKTFANHAAYCGTKFAVHAISENIREEVAQNNVRVVTIAPGAAETELLSHTTSENIKGDYEDWKTQIGGALKADDIADAIIYAYGQPQNVCVREIVIAPTKQQP